MDQGTENGHRLPLRKVISSVLSAAFGVQSTKNRERDFEHGTPSTFIILGIVATLVFVIALLLLVKFVTYLSG